MTSKHTFICFMSLIFLQNAFIIQGDPDKCISQKCTDQATACNDDCFYFLYGCWAKCTTNGCANMCISGSGNAAAINVGTCALQKGCSPFQTKDNRENLVSIQRENLKSFENKVGQQFGQSQLNTLINLINQAANLYSNDVEKNIKYIKENMDASFPSQRSLYSVLIQNSPVKDFSGLQVFIDFNNDYASLSKGICLKNPTWSYFVYKIFTFDHGQWNYIDNNYGRGSGVTEDQEAQIISIIKKIDGTKPCDCLNTHQIVIKIRFEVGGLRNIICQSAPGTYSYVQITNSAWLTPNASACSYFIYSIG